jgi:RNA polymerase-binding transcription factor DksA
VSDEHLERAPADDSVAEAVEVEAGQAPVAPDLDVIEADLADVEIALERLDSGEYWRDEATGEPLEDAVLEQRPTARRNPG